MKKRVRMLSLLLSACMMLNLAPLPVYASEAQAEVAVDESFSDVDTPAEEEEVQSEETNTENETPAEETDKEDFNNEADTEENQVVVEEPEVEELVGEGEEAPETPAEEPVTEKENESEYFEVTDGVLTLKSGVDKNKLPKKITLDLFAKTNAEITKIGADVFAGSSIMEITVPKTVSEFGVGAFKDCRSLTTFAFEDSTSAATVISEDMFSGCANLKWSGSSVYFAIPDSVTVIGKNAFSGCTALQGINIGSSVTTISDYAFNGCTNLVKLEGFGSSKVATIGEYAFSGTAIDDDERNVKFPSTLTKIKSNAFAKCEYIGIVDLSNTSLTSEGLDARCFADSHILGIKLPASYKTVPAGVFEDCKYLEQITIGSKEAGKGVEVIEPYAFKNCDRLKKVILENSVTTVKDFAFDNCTSLKTIEINQKDIESGLTSVKLTADSFPIYQGLEIYSYSGTGEEWAGTHKADGIVYKSKFTGMNVVTNGASLGNSLSANPGKNVSVGTKVTVKDTPASGYYLISMTHGPLPTGVDYTKRFVDSSKSFVVSSADIKNNEIVVNAAFAKLPNDVTFTFEDSKDANKVVRDGKEFSVTYDTANQIEQLLIRAKTNNGYGTVYSNPWLWNFATSDKSVVTVDANGKIKLLKKTSANKTVYVTATLKANTNIQLKLKVKVNGETKFKDVKGVEFPNRPYKFENGIDTDAGMPYIQTSKAWVEAGASNKLTRDFEVKVDAVDELDNSIESSFKWQSGDTAIAKVKSATTDCNENTIMICGVGETTITATSTVDANKSISFIVRVVDKTPYVADETITINAPATEIDSVGSIAKGIEFSLIQAYGGVIAKDHITVVKKNGSKWDDLSEYFVVEKYGDLKDNVQKMLIAVAEGTSYYNNNASYTNLYLKLSVDGDYYYVAFPKVTIANKKPAPSISKITGKINTFYTNDAPEQGEVVIKLKSPTGYAFDNSYKPVLESAETDTEENFSKNFKVLTTDDKDYTTLKIVQKQRILEPNTKNKVITTGYLKFKYNGYDACKLKITVPTGRTAPSLSLEKTSVTTHKYAKGQTYEISLLEKVKNKKEVVDIDDSFTSVEYTGNSSYYFNYNSLEPAFDKANDKLVVKLADEAPSTTAKACMLVENKYWTSPVSFNLTINVSSAKPSIAISDNSQINLNLANSTSNYVTFNVKSDFMDGAKATFDGFNTTNGGKARAEAEKIKVVYADGKITATVDSKNRPKCGTYTFKSAYEVPYTGSNTLPYSAFATVKVKIYETKPVISLKTTATTLNNTLVGVKDSNGNLEEIAKIPYTVKNSWAGANNTVNNGSYKITNVTSGNKKNHYDYSSVSAAPVSLSFVDGNLYVYLNKRLANTEKFKLSGITVDGVAAPDITLTVKATNAKPVLTIKSNNKKINVLQAPTDAVTYTLALKNYNGQIDASKFMLTSEINNKATQSWNNDTNTFHFMLDEQEGNKCQLKANSKYIGKIKNQNYIYKGVYVFGNGSVKTDAVELSTKPIQTMPKVTQSSTKATVYIGNKAKTAKIIVTPKEGSTAKISNVVWSTKTNKTLQKAFANPVYDETTNALTIQIKNAALLKKNTTYTLTYNIVCEGQLEGSTGTEFTVKVLVK